MTTTNQIAGEVKFNSHLLTTNTIPSPYDRSIIAHMLSSIDKDISQTELDIAQLQKALEERKADHASLMQRRASVAVVVSPLRQLPLEILGQIFMYATLDDPRFPISASHVCQLWRQASLASSDIWTSIRIGNHCRKEYVALFIQRSRSRPMSLKCTEDLPVQSLPDVSTLLSDVGRDCQWKEVQIHPSWDNLPKILSKSWDTVEALTLNSTDSRPIVLDLESASRLTRLSIGHDKPLKFTHYKLPFACLTYLTLNIRASPKTVITIMSQCRKLEECTLIFRATTKNYNPTPLALLPNLRKLHIRSHQAEVLVNLLQTPAIEDLLLDFDGTDFDSQGSSVTEFINASKATLRKFSISMISDHDLMDLLEGMSRVNELRVIGNDEFEGDFLTALVAGRKKWKKPRVVINARHRVDAEEGSEMLLPNLGALHVICKTYAHVQEAFLEAVRSRSLKTAFLQSIGSDQRLAFGAEADEIRRQGVDIKMLEGHLKEEADWVRS